MSEKTPGEELRARWMKARFGQRPPANSYSMLARLDREAWEAIAGNEITPETAGGPYAVTVKQLADALANVKIPVVVGDEVERHTPVRPYTLAVSLLAAIDKENRAEVTEP